MNLAILRDKLKYRAKNQSHLEWPSYLILWPIAMQTFSENTCHIVCEPNFFTGSIWSSFEMLSGSSIL